MWGMMLLDLPVLRKVGLAIMRSGTAGQVLSPGLIMSLKLKEERVR